MLSFSVSFVLTFESSDIAILIIVIIIIVVVVVVSCQKPVLPVASPEPKAIPITQDSSFKLQYFPYYV